MSFYLPTLWTKYLLRPILPDSEIVLVFVLSSFFQTVQRYSHQIICSVCGNVNRNQLAVSVGPQIILTMWWFNRNCKSGEWCLLKLGGCCQMNALFGTKMLPKSGVVNYSLTKGNRRARNGFKIYGWTVFGLNDYKWVWFLTFSICFWLGSNVLLQDYGSKF